MWCVRCGILCIYGVYVCGVVYYVHVCVYVCGVLCVYGVCVWCVLCVVYVYGVWGVVYMYI